MEEENPEEGIREGVETSGKNMGLCIWGRGI
jgi:hypothetical protein